MDDWNVLATSVEGARPVLLAGLRRRGAFRGGGYRNVAIGRVGDVPAFLAGLRDDVARDTVLAGALARVLPIDHTFRLDGDDPMTSLEAAGDCTARCTPAKGSAPSGRSCGAGSRRRATRPA